MVSIVPAWEDGAIMRWSIGKPTLLAHYKYKQQVGLQRKWIETAFRFDEVLGVGTRIEAEVLERSGVSFPDCSKAQIDDISTAIDRLKRIMEGVPFPDMHPVIKKESVTADQQVEAPSLRGRSYLALITATIGIGFIFSLIPILVVTALIAGVVAAWLWVRREATPRRLRVCRGLLAGMLAGIGGSLIGIMFFLSYVAEIELSTIIYSITSTFTFFLLPVALSGWLMGYILSRKRERGTTSTQSPLQPSEAHLHISTAMQPAIQHNRIVNRMLASATQGMSHLSDSTKADTTRQIVTQIATGEEFDYAVERVEVNLPICLAGYKPRSEVKQFPGSLVAITVFPVWTAEQVCKLLPEGYVNLVQELVAPLKDFGEKAHIAHWAFASDGNLINEYLTVIPNPDIDSDAPTLIARELLNAKERTDLGV